MTEPLRFYIVDDNSAVADTAKAMLESAGYEATVCTSSLEALRVIPQQRPDGVLLDMMMPELDGLELCRELRAMSELRDLKIIMFSGKVFNYDQQQAFEMGADGYILKPPRLKTFIEQVNKVMLDKVELRFWGVRGTLPRPGDGSIRYGGNTSCVSLRFPRGQFFVFDAGTGIKRLSNDLMASGAQRLKGKIFISHPHWDHINAIPFFTPLFIPGNDFEIIGASHGSLSMRDLVSAQMSSVYFPITTREFGANVYYRDIRGGVPITADDIEVQTMLLSHPGSCLGYRINYHGRSLCYITDNELFLPSSDFYSSEYVEHLAAFVANADILITDTTYMDDEYMSKVGWGHSCVSQVIDLAAQAQVKTLYLFHHDPDQDDTAIDNKLAVACEMLAQRGASVTCVAPTEGQLVMV